MEADDFEEILNAYEGQLIGYANTILGDIERAKDAVQDTFLRLWNQPTSPASVKPWLYTTCRNRCIDILRKENRIVSIENCEPWVLKAGGKIVAEYDVACALCKSKRRQTKYISYEHIMLCMI